MPLFWISIAFIAGVVVSLFQSIPWLIATGVGIFLFVLGFFERRTFSHFSFYSRLRKVLPIPICLLAAALCGGLVRGETGKPAFDPGQLAYYNGQEFVKLTVVVSQPVENHDSSTMMTVSAREAFIGIHTHVVTGDAVILLPAGMQYAYGDLLEITGSLETPPERADFSYKQYLENRGVYSYMAYPRIQIVEQNSGNPILAAIFTLRDRIARSVTQTVPQPEAAFLSGMLVGRDEAIPDGLKNAFRDTGTSHLVAISGFNITILGGLILALTTLLLPHGWSVWTAIALLSGYAVMAGGSPSVVRAAIMGALAMVGRSIGRNRTAVNSLGLAAAGMVMINPLILRDIGFQLSVVATAGILLIGAPLNDYFVEKMTGPEKAVEVNQIWSTLGDSMLITLAAQAATLPVLLFHFHQYPLIGLLVNPLVLPVQPAAMVLGGAAALAGMVFLPLGKLVGLAAWVPLAYTTRMVELFSSAHGIGLINLHLELWQATALGSILVLGVVFQKSLWNRVREGVIAAACVGLLLTLVILVNTLYLRPDGRLHIQVFRQGKDLSSYIVTPGGQRLLVTNRPGDKDLIAFVDRRLPILDKNLDAVLLPNPTASSSIFLGDSLGHFQPEWLLVNTQAGGSKVQSKLKTELADGDLQLHPFESGQQLDLGRGALLTFQQVDEQGSRMILAWGSQRYDIQYGNSTGNEPEDPFQTEPMDVLILDHPQNQAGGHTAAAILDADSLTTDSTTQLSVPDGKWLEVRSDGQSTLILEAAVGND